jgi:hypothetical protein
MTAAESYFLQSEAVLRNYMGGNAEQLYHNGIKASFETLDLTAAQATTYYSATNNPKAYWNNAGTFTQKLNLIMMQKYAAENSITPFEVWCDYRRLPTLPFHQSIPISNSPAVDAPAIPVRILYPTSEYQTNAENVGAQNQAGNAHHTQKIFWMK